MPLMTIGDWLFLLEQYAVEAQNERLAIHPATVLRWVESLRDDHPELHG